jgi:hypothetical protein
LPFPNPNLEGGGRSFEERQAIDAEGVSDRSVTAALRDLLEQGRLIAWGRRGSATGNDRSIPPSAWRLLRFRDLHLSIVSEHGGGKARMIFDVRLYPVLEAPDAVEHVTGMTFADACQALVLADPEVAVAAERAADAGGKPLAHTSSAGRMILPIGHDPATAAKSRARETTAARLIREADAILRARFDRLIRLLAEGDVAADGVGKSDGELSSIPRVYWLDRRIRVDLATGDLLREIRRTSFALRAVFTRVSLRAPSEQTRLADSNDNQKAGRPPRWPREDSRHASMDEFDACYLMLCEAMRKNPEQPTKRKDEWWRVARKKWRQLSYRKFQLGWAQAVVETRAFGWSRPGRKSMRI